MSVKVVGIIGVAFALGLGSGFLLKSDSKDVSDSVTEWCGPQKSDTELVIIQ